MSKRIVDIPSRQHGELPPSVLNPSAQINHHSTSALGSTNAVTAIHSASQSPLVSAKGREDANSAAPAYYAQRLIGTGTFGSVFIAKAKGSDETVAIKRYIYDRKYRNREVFIMQQICGSNGGKGHPYIIKLKGHFSASASVKGGKSDDIYLNLVLEYVPETLHSLQKQYTRRRQGIPDLLVKIYTYQMLRALAHIHGMGIAHRDIKPQNLLVDPLRHTLKLCDFGSAKTLIKGEPNVAYICSRFYRAPELILGCTEYDTAIDVWSAGCVFAELMLGMPVFHGMSAADQLIEIVKILGTPTSEQLLAMTPTGMKSGTVGDSGNHNAAGDNNGNGAAIRIPPSMVSKSWKDILPTPCTSAGNPHTVALLERLLRYSPKIRIKAIDACAHPFFNELRDSTKKMPDGSTPPVEMFTFTTEELSLASFETVHFLGESNPTKKKNINNTHGNTTSPILSTTPLRLPRKILGTTNSGGKEHTKSNHIHRMRTMSETSSDESSSDDE